MDSESYRKYEAYMLSQMNDSAHDCQHVYRVLYLALDIARSESGVDMDVLIVASLLHDIGRSRQFENPRLSHAVEGGAMAYDYLLEQGWSADKAERVRKCIASHRYRTDSPPDSIEAKILFDADKLDATGAMGIARTLIYQGQVNVALYTLCDDGSISEDADSSEPSFVKEYNFKLKKLYDRFYTKRGVEIAAERRAAAVNFYEGLICEVKSAHETGKKYLGNVLFS